MAQRFDRMKALTRALVHSSVLRNILVGGSGRGDPQVQFQAPAAKIREKNYRVRNWAEYEAALRRRGSLTVWLAVDDVADGPIPGWNAAVRRNRKRGRQRKYSRLAIETSLRIGAVYHVPSRQTEGFLRSLFFLLKLTADVPDHSTVSRRSAGLGRVRSRAQLGKRDWHRQSGYSLRAKVETTVSRYQNIFGPAMKARRLAAQRAEARIRCQILNTMAALGMPDGHMVG